MHIRRVTTEELKYRIKQYLKKVKLNKELGHIDSYRIIKDKFNLHRDLVFTLDGLKYLKDPELEKEIINLALKDIQYAHILAVALGIKWDDILEFVQRAFETKGIEYSGEEDRLRNFKLVGDLLYTEPYRALLTYKIKHNCSLEFILHGGKSIEGTLGRLGDDVAYNMLLYIMIKAMEI